MRFIFVIIFLAYFISFSSGQSVTFKSTMIPKDESNHINEILSAYHLFTFDTESFHQYLAGSRSETDNVTIHIGEQNYSFHIEPVQIINEKTGFFILSSEGKKPYRKPIGVKTYKGRFTDGREGNIRLTVSDHFIYGVINDEGEEMFIEPLKYFDHNSRSDHYVLYKTSDVTLSHNSYYCNKKPHELHRFDPAIETTQFGACYKTRLAILADYSMVTDPAHPGVDAVIDHVVAVMNNVQSNFEYNGTTNFNDGINFEISELVISTCQTCDPISSQTNAGSLLSEFSAWIDQSGFYHPFHAAHFWTNRDLANSTVGVAFQSQNLFCQSRARAVFEDWTSTAALLKITVSHEIGHSFNGVHDAANSNFILAPSININNSTWSSTSKTTIGGQIAIQGPDCLSACFTPLCQRLDNIEISNITNNNFTVSWSASPQQWYTIKVREAGATNFIVNFNTSAISVVISPPGYGICKKYDVFVYNNCNGNGLSAANRLLNIGPLSQGCSDFSVNRSVGWSGSNFSFFDKSLNAVSWLWNFGNGQTSTLKNPTVTYSNAGNYTISLTVNGVHTITRVGFVKVLPSFSAPFSLIQGGDFESNTTAFSSEVIEGLVNVWEFGSSSYGLATQGNAWKSKLSSNIPQVTSKSALYSPRFDLSGYQNYTLQFDIGMEVAYCNAPVAVQLQYSTDNGISWSRLGASPSLYNAGAGMACKIAPQIFADTTGWTLNTYYANKSVDLSFLAGNTSVIFRFVVSISGIFNGGYDVDGVLIDNFRLNAVNQVPLPLDINSLKAYPKGKVNKLEWKSDYPIDIERYEILRSRNGIHFSPLDIVNQKNINETSFEYTDLYPLEGMNFYKVTAKHHDGSEISTNIAKAKQEANTLINIYPNPVLKNQPLNIKFNAGENDWIKIEIFDIFGTNIKIPESKLHPGLLNTDFLNSSIYYLNIILSDGSVFQERILVI